jgi:hypothetical protein
MTQDGQNKEEEPLAVSKSHGCHVVIMVTNFICVHLR